MSNGYIVISVPYIISMTICPRGVKNTLRNKIVTTKPATILETTKKTYIIEEIIQLDGSPTIHIDLCMVIDTKVSKKSDYRPICREFCDILINQDYIVSRTLTNKGIYDNNMKKIVTTLPSTIIETCTKTYVAGAIYHMDLFDKFLRVKLSDIQEVTVSSKANYISN